MTISSNRLIRESLRELQQRLPQGWTASDAAPTPTPTPALPVLTVTAPDLRASVLTLCVRTSLEPRGVRALVEGVDGAPADARLLVVAPYLSARTRELLREAEVGYLDLTGNARLTLSDPGLYINTHGAEEDPNRDERPARSLRGVKAGRIALALIENLITPGVRELAALTATDPGYVSRVISLLETEALLRRGGKGSATEVAWPALLRRWAQDAPLASRGAIGTYLAPRGLGALQQQLSSFEGTYAITGSMAADALAPLASPRLATIWVSDAAAASLALSLPQVDSGANVLLVEAPDGTPFERRVARDGVWHANPALVAADLLTSPGRGPQEGEALISWMMRNEAAWRR